MCMYVGGGSMWGWMESEPATWKTSLPCCLSSSETPFLVNSSCKCRLEGLPESTARIKPPHLEKHSSQGQCSWEYVSWGKALCMERK